MTGEKIRTLIAALRANVDQAAHGTPPTMAAKIRAGESDDDRLALMVQAADALSALTVPDGDAREALLRLNIAGEIEAEDEASGPFPDKANAYYDGLQRAAEIVRKGR